jgi:release factor glutamine methyltransferase
MSDGDGGGRPALADLREIDAVYQPAEDSLLLAETAIASLEGHELVLDVGTGSGYVGERIDEETGATVIGSDLNPHALRSAVKRGLPVVRASLLEPYRANAFDAVVFNPPYLPTRPDREWDDWMERALSGGEDGRAVVDPFLAGVGRVLRDGGRAYLLISTLTGPDEVRDFAREHGLTSTIVAEESHPFEKLLVVQFSPDRP